jgi:hypothetical protein
MFFISPAGEAGLFVEKNKTRHGLHGFDGFTRIKLKATKSRVVHGSFLDKLNP